MTADLMVASIALANDASGVTRDTADFEHCSIKFIDPWTTS